MQSGRRSCHAGETVQFKFKIAGSWDTNWGYSYSEVSMANEYPWTNKHLFVVLGLIVIVYIVGIVAFSQVAYPNTTIAGVDVSFSNASSAATKVNSAWKHYKLTVTGDDFSWTYQPLDI